MNRPPLAGHMSGPQHYTAAEHLAEAAHELLTDSQRVDTSDTHAQQAADAQYAERLLAHAQVHATLAGAAAIASQMEAFGGPHAAEWGPVLTPHDDIHPF